MEVEPAKDLGHEQCDQPGIPPSLRLCVRARVRACVHACLCRLSSPLCYGLIGALRLCTDSAWVLSTPGRDYHFAAQSADEKRKWVAAMRAYRLRGI